MIIGPARFIFRKWRRPGDAPETFKEPAAHIMQRSAWVNRAGRRVQGFLKVVSRGHREPRSLRRSGLNLGAEIASAQRARLAMTLPKDQGPRTKRLATCYLHTFHQPP